MKLPEHLNKFINLNKIDADFLMCIANTALISLDDLQWILSLSNSDFVEYPLDDSEYIDINEGYEEKYEWDGDSSPIRISIYGNDIDYETSDFSWNITDNEVRDGRLLGLTIDFTECRVKNPSVLFSAINFALQKFGDDLALETLCLCGLRRDLSDKFTELSIRLPYLKTLIINRIKLLNVNFIAAPRLEELNIIDSTLDEYDLSRMLAIKVVCIGDQYLKKIILPNGNSINKIILGKGYLPTVRETKDGLGISLNDLISNIGFSVEYLSLSGCGFSKVDLSVCSNLKHLNLSNNPINKLNLSWVPGLEYLNLEGTGIQNVDSSDLTKLKHFLANATELNSAR